MSLKSVQAENFSTSFSPGDLINVKECSMDTLKSQRLLICLVSDITLFFPQQKPWLPGLHVLFAYWVL